MRLFIFEACFVVSLMMCYIYLTKSWHAPQAMLPQKTWKYWQGWAKSGSSFHMKSWNLGSEPWAGNWKKRRNKQAMSFHFMKNSTSWENMVLRFHLCINASVVIRYNQTSFCHSQSQNLLNNFYQNLKDFTLFVIMEKNELSWILSKNKINVHLYSWVKCNIKRLGYLC